VRGGSRRRIPKEIGLGRDSGVTMNPVKPNAVMSRPNWNFLVGVRARSKFLTATITLVVEAWAESTKAGS
jgi:hypothetical protein